MQPVSLGIITVPTPGTPVSIGSVMAIVVGTEVGPFAVVVDESDKLLLSVDGGVDQEVTLTAGVARTALQVVGEINSQTTDLTASVAGGKVVLASNTMGATSSILIQAATNDANVVLGFDVGTTTGVNDLRCSKIRLTPLKDNDGDIFVGTKVNFDSTTGDGLLDRLMKPLSTPATLDTFNVETQEDSNSLHTRHYFIDATNAGDGVMAAIWIA